MSIPTMDCGRSLRLLMTDRDIPAGELGEHLNISATTVSTLRRSTVMSGKNIEMLSEYFGISAADFIRKGEKG